jgi:hypothetical protein
LLSFLLFVGGHAIAVILVCHASLLLLASLFLIYSLMLTSLPLLAPLLVFPHLLLSFVPAVAGVPTHPGVPILASVLRSVPYHTGTLNYGTTTIDCFFFVLECRPGEFEQLPDIRSRTQPIGYRTPNNYRLLTFAWYSIKQSVVILWLLVAIRDNY